MRDRRVGVMVAAVLASAAPVASAHEFTCSAGAGVLAVDDGNVALAAPGTPIVFGGSVQPVLTVLSYPAVIGVEVTLRNVASETSVMTGMWDTIDSTGGAPAERFGPFFGAGVAIPVGGSLVGWFAQKVMSQEECLKVFGGQAQGPTCTDATDFRFVATSDAGSTECRARIVCGLAGPPPVVLGPPPPPTCPPTWHGVQQFGTANQDFAGAIALDAQCNVDVALHYDVVPANVPSGVAALARFTPAAAMDQLLQWGTPPAWAVDVAVDATGNRLVTWGSLGSSTSQLAKLDASGAQVWNEPLQPGTSGAVAGVALDGAGNAYVVGADASSSALAIKVAPDGTTVWTSTFSPPGCFMSGASGAAVDPAGNVLVAVTANCDPAHPPRTEAFAAKLDPAGNLLWIRQGWFNAWAGGIASDGSGNVFVAGTTVDTSSPGAFVTKFDPAGVVLWNGHLGTVLAAGANGVAASADGDAWVVGWANLPFEGQPIIGDTDAWIARLDPAGNVRFARTFGTDAYDQATDVAIDAQGDAFVSGVTKGALGGPPSGDWDAFVAKFDPAGNLQ